jgi:DnaJ-class molecular chaperone
METTSPDILKASYKSLVLSNHPDRSKEVDSQQKFVAVREAWEILSNPEAKESYDRFLADRRFDFWVVFLKRVSFENLIFFPWQESGFGSSARS